MWAQAALSTGPTGTGSATRSPSSCGTQDTLAFSCLNLWSIRRALRRWGPWRPLRQACWRSVRQTGTDFHIYDHTVCTPDPQPHSYLSPQLVFLWDFIWIPDIIRRGAARQHGFSFVFSCFFKVLHLILLFWKDMNWWWWFFFCAKKTPQNPRSNQFVYIQRASC